MNDDQLHLPDLPGFELQEAVRRLGGKWDRLQKIVLRFIDTYKDAHTSLIALLQNKQYGEAERLVHQIKGSGANVGAMDISNISAEIESLLKAGERIIPAPLLDEFSYCVSALVQAGKILEGDNLNNLEAEPAIVRREINLDNIEQCLQSIQEYLNSDIFKVEQDIKALEDQCRGSILEGFATQIRSEFDEFDIAEISRRIDQYFSTSL